ncbi:MAG: choice-of-anchor tandem repeat GloVer-containing protein [Limisphaerales bacterium]
MVVSSNVVYGTTQGGGNGNAGVIFKVNTNGTGYTVLKYFSSAMYGDGKNSYSGLTLSGGILYGTTSQGGGGGGNGTVFKINTDGTGYTVLKAFTTDGAIPKAGCGDCRQRDLRHHRSRRQRRYWHRVPDEYGRRRLHFAEKFYDRRRPVSLFPPLRF